MITETYEICSNSQTSEQIEVARRLGFLVNVYRKFHRETNNMLPDRAHDFGDTCSVIEENFSESQRNAFYSSSTGEISELPSEHEFISEMPFLSEVTTVHDDDSSYSFQA